MNTVSAPPSIPDFGPPSSVEKLGDDPAASSSDGAGFASQMRALLDETNSGTGSQLTGVSTPGRTVSTVETGSTKPPEAAVVSTAFKHRRLSIGMWELGLLSDQARPSQGPGSSQLAQVDLPLPMADSPALRAAVLIGQATHSNLDIPKLRAESEAASGDQGLNAVNSALVDAPLAIPQAVSGSPAAAFPHSVGVVTGLVLQSISSASITSLNTIAGAAAGVVVHGVDSTSRMATLTGAPTTPQPPAPPITDSSLAFAARLSDGSIPSPDRPAMTGIAVAAKTTDLVKVEGLAEHSEPLSTATEQDSNSQRQDLRRTTLPLIGTSADDELARVQAGVDEPRQPHSDLSGVISMSTPRGDAAATPQRSTAAAQPFANLETLTDLEDPAQSQPLREITIRVAANTSQSADVRMLERNGEIQVTVRASDPALNSSLRSNVNSLVSSLSLEGTSAEVWHPGLTAQPGANTDSRQPDSSDSSQFHQRAEQRFQQPSDQGSGREGREKPEWLEEFE